MNGKKLLLFALLGIILFSGYRLLSGAGRREPDVRESTEGEMTGIEEGDIAPDITLRDLDGNEISLWDYRGKAVLLNFWATWCPPCRYEKPFMQQVYDEYKDEGFVILALSVREEKQTVQNYIESGGYTYPVFLDKDGSSFAKYNKTGGIPQTYLIDTEGKINTFISGARQWTDASSRRLIENILEN